MKTIPQIRQELLKLANTVNVTTEAARKIKRLVKQMKRRPAVRRAKTEHATFTPAIAAKIRRTARENPGMSYATMSRMPQHRVSIGRISEALAGKRAA